MFLNPLGALIVKIQEVEKILAARIFSTIVFVVGNTLNNGF